MFNKVNIKFLRILTITLICTFLFSITGCSSNNTSSQDEKVTLKLAEPSWDSAQFHNRVAQFILEKGYGYPTETMVGSSVITLAGLIKGDIDICMEVWTDNYGDTYDNALESGDLIELGVNYDDNAQGVYVPTYLIEGDKDRGIEALAPDLRSIKDLDKYWKLFKDPENPQKGRLYGAIPGWYADEILGKKLESYGLDKYYDYFSPGSDAALAGSITKAYKAGEPWVGYYWEPTWIMGKYDMTLLEDELYSLEKWNDNYQCEFPSVRCTVAVYKDLLEKAPDVVDFLKKYHTSSDLTSEALAYMQENDATAEEAALWFLKEQQDLWKSWVPEEIAVQVTEALEK